VLNGSYVAKNPKLGVVCQSGIPVKLNTVSEGRSNDIPGQSQKVFGLSPGTGSTFTPEYPSESARNPVLLDRGTMFNFARTPRSVRRVWFAIPA
jgi:hypothetical protein